MRKTKAQPPRELQWHWHNSRSIGKYSSTSQSLLIMTNTDFVSHITLTCLNRAFSCIHPALGLSYITLSHLLPRGCTKSLLEPDRAGNPALGGAQGLSQGRICVDVCMAEGLSPGGSGRWICVPGLCISFTAHTAAITLVSNTTDLPCVCV